MAYYVGQKVHIRDKDVSGLIAYIGNMDFAPGVWVGIKLDEAKGKNNGSVQGVSNCDMFVRQSQLSQVADVTAETPASVGHGRSSPVQQVESSATSVKTERTTEPSAETKPSLPMGRGRGFKPKIKPVAVQSAPPDTSKLGKVVLDDAESFRSEEFETSSRIGTQPFDAGQLAEKLTV